MENSPKFQETQSPSLVPPPNSHSTNGTSSSSSSNSNSNGLHHLSPPPTTPKPITRSEPNNPFPTTFVQADSSSFKQVVQMLTGSSETAKQAAAASRPDPPKNHIPPIKTGPKKQPSSKLYERRNSLKSFKISPLVSGLVHNSGFMPRKPATPELLSPSMLDLPSLVLSPVTPLIPDPFNRSPHIESTPVGSIMDMEAENQAIAKKSFYLHPSPASTPRDSEPRLLPLFPVTSPRVSGSS